MSKGRKWYKKEEYNQPVEPFDPGDGSIIEVVKDPCERYPDALKLTRIWPDNHETTVRFTPPTKFAHRFYISIEGERKLVESNVYQPSSLNRSEGTIPMVRSISAVPGNNPRDSFDSATNQHFETRARFNEYYKQNNLEKVPANDSSLDNGKGVGGAYKGAAQQFDPAAPPPVPREFQGVKFHYGGT